MKRIGWGLLAVAGMAYLVLFIVLMVLAFPVGIIGLLAITGVGFVFAQVLMECIGNQEDNHYSKNVHQ